MSFDSKLQQFDFGTLANGAMRWNLPSVLQEFQKSFGIDKVKLDRDTEFVYPSSMPSAKKILIVDDDDSICEFVQELLAFRFDVRKALTAADGLSEIEKDAPDLIILDLGLENQSGLDICKFLRENAKTKHIPVMVYSGSDCLEQMTEAFHRGADDYIIKTARPRELVARVLAKIRRVEEQTETPEILHCGNLQIDSGKLEASIQGQVITLSVLEFNLLRFFVLNKERVMNREQILETVWKDSSVSNRTIDSHMVYLRKKIEGCDYVLATIYGAGYVLRADRQ